MRKSYSHLQIKDRISIYELLFNGHSIGEIAAQIGFHRSTVYRELNRNSSQCGYRPDWACHQYSLKNFKVWSRQWGHLSRISIFRLCILLITIDGS